MTKYLSIAAELSKRIREGIYPAGESIPDQKTLANEFNTSRMTIQKSLDVLNAEGLSYSIQGSGTYVKKNANFISDFKVRSDQYVGTTQLFGKNHKVTSKIIDFHISNPTDDEQKALKITRNQPVYNIIRLRYIDESAYALEYTTMPTEVIPRVTEDVLLKSIYQHIQKTLGLTIGAAYRTISADKPEHFDRKYLACESSDPVLQVQQVVYLDDGTAFEFSHTRQRFDKGKYVILEPDHPNQ